MLHDAYASLRTAVTLAACALLLVLAALWGWQALTEPFPQKTVAAICEDTEVASGDRVFPAQVVVNVLNASDRSGLAGRTLGELRDRGFVAGDSGDAPARSKVQVAQIWSSDPASPAVRLVRSWLPRAHVVDRSVGIPGVVVVVGGAFGEVGGGVKSVKATKDTTICSPPID